MLLSPPSSLSLIKSSSSYAEVVGNVDNTFISTINIFNKFKEKFKVF